MYFDSFLPLIHFEKVRGPSMTGPVSPGGRSRRCTRLVDHNHDYKQLSENYTLVTAMVLLCVQLLALVAVCAASLGPVVHIDDGILRGRYLATRNGREFSAFQAIPFARPPVGHLRFQVTKTFLPPNLFI